MPFNSIFNNLDYLKGNINYKFITIVALSKASNIL